MKQKIRLGLEDAMTVDLRLEQPLLSNDKAESHMLKRWHQKTKSLGGRETKNREKPASAPYGPYSMESTNHLLYDSGLCDRLTVY